jgi:hypothetical protein
MSKTDTLLKTLQVRPSPPEALVQAYLIHIADKSDTNFRKILDIKGIRKADQANLMDLFNAFKASPNHAGLSQNSPLLTPLQLQAGQGIGSLGNAGGVMGGGLGVMGVGNAGIGSGRFDPAGLGNAMVSAVREGVDRFGSPAPGAMQGGDAAVGVGGEAKGNLNENLKNLGKFFRRDGFRGFGRSEEAGR